MRSFGSRLTRDAASYGLGGAANQLAAIVLVPIYARVLGPSGVGVVGVLQSTISLSLVLVGLAWPQAFLRWYLREHGHDRDEVVGTTLSIRLAASIVGLAIILLGTIPLTSVLYGGDNQEVFALVAPIVVLDAFNAIPLTYFRAERRPGPYLLIAIARSVLGGLLIVGFVVGLHLGVFGVAAGMVAAASLTAIAGLVLLARSVSLRLSFDRELAAAMFRFAAPLIPAAAAGWILNMADRPLLQAITGSTEVVGVYSLGYTGGLVVSAVVVQPFALAWGAAHWELGDDAPRRFARVMTSYLAIAVGVSVLLSALGTDIIRILVGPAFEESRYIVPFSAFGYVFYGAHVIAFAGFSVSGRTSRAAFGMGVAALVAIGLNLALIPALGMYGAAIATIAGYIVLLMLDLLLGQRHFPVPWQAGRGVAIVGYGAALSAAALLGPDHALWRGACLAAYAPVLWPVARSLIR